MNEGIEPNATDDEKDSIERMQQHGLEVNNGLLIDDLCYKYKPEGSGYTNKLMNGKDERNDTAHNLLLYYLIS